MKSEKIRQKKMDETLEDSFPASDPPSWSQPRPEKELKVMKAETKARPGGTGKHYGKDEYLASSSQQG